MELHGLHEKWSITLVYKKKMHCSSGDIGDREYTTQMLVTNSRKKLIKRAFCSKGYFLK